MAKEPMNWKTVKGVLFWPLLFVGIGIWRLLATGSWFFLVNFGYIGLAIGLGDFLTRILGGGKKVWGRKVTQLMIGLYMLGFLGFVGHENMQIEGFFFYLFAGVFAGATLHYFIAKIAGPLIFGRAWCGWACWTAMVLDFLPWTRPRQGRIKYAGLLRYLHLLISLILVSVVVLGFGSQLTRRSELIWMVAGNMLYYGAALVLAAALKDNRAFCKYACPIPPLQKAATHLSLMRIQADMDVCNRCRVCEKNCPMDIRLLEYFERGERVLSSECILCQTCVRVCPTGALKAGFKLDIGFSERIRFKSPG
jgi:polyferredoxin